jgi:CRP-like cAMP-binding protein
MTRTAPPVSCRASCNSFDCELCRELLDAGVSLEQGADFDTGIHECEYDHASGLYRIAAPVDAVYSILAGTVKIVKVGPAGEQRIVRLLRSGDIAEVESISSLTFEHTAIAAGKVRACRIPIAWFRIGLAGTGRMQTLLLQQSLAALKETETWFSRLTARTTPVRTRTAQLLLRLRVDAGDRILRFSVDEMGAILNVRPETVSRVLSDFGRRGIVAKESGSVTAQLYFRGNIAALEKFAQEI